MPIIKLLAFVLLNLNYKKLNFNLFDTNAYRMQHTVHNKERFVCPNFRNLNMNISEKF
jgi:hypothetical protein